MKFLNSQIDFVNQEQKFLDSTIEETYIIVLDQTEAIYGKDDSCNIKYCQEHNIPYIHQSKLSGGGCIIGVKGNIFIDIKREHAGGKCLSDTFSEALKDFFVSKGLSSVRCDNNDVLVDGYKVASGCECSYNKWEYMGYQISIFQDIETIKNVCNKPMVKIPKGLNDYGITTEEIKKFCEEYFKTH